MATRWLTTDLTEVRQAEGELKKLEDERWACRGQSRPYGSLTPSIDRKRLGKLGRPEKLKLERRSIESFQGTATVFAPGEEGSKTDAMIALMVLRHYGAPTRLLDWSRRPLVAAHFACCSHDGDDGELWSFDYAAYELFGKQQWRDHPETTTDGSGDDDKFDAKLTAFTADEVLDWFCCAFYYPGFPRQKAQEGYYSLTRLFEVDHAAAIAGLLKDPKLFHRYVIKGAIKGELRRMLREKYGVWRGLLFPDSAGAAETVNLEVFGTV